uniref:Uncharacterized protein n=1 Tax=Nelumbo nucifera TaxID=4432 RepID=A0A822YFD5_NELNU|nr:TPA_asm: hypothetical protein HUJ06_029706 [Nelumbo nucifera]
MRRSCSISLPILVVLSAIAYIYYTTVFIFIEGWFGLRTSPGLMNAVILTVTAFMCIFNYVIAIVRDPGLVPATFMPDIEDAETPVHEIKRKVSTASFRVFFHSFLLLHCCFGDSVRGVSVLCRYLLTSLNFEN